MNDKIKEQLDKNERSKAWLAKKLGIDYSTLYRKYKGITEWTVAEKLAMTAIFGVSVDYFKEGEE